MYNFEILNKKERERILESILIDSGASMLSNLEKKVLYRICKQGISPKYRRILWLRASGAYSLMSMKQNLTYYAELREKVLSSKKSSMADQIEVDIKRTFFDIKTNH